MQAALPKFTQLKSTRTISTQDLTSFYDDPIASIKAFELIMKDVAGLTKPRFVDTEGNTVSFSESALDALMVLPSGVIHIEGKFWNAMERDVDCQLILVGKVTAQNVIEYECAIASSDLSGVISRLHTLENSQSLPKPMRNATKLKLQNCIAELNGLNIQIKKLSETETTETSEEKARLEEERRAYEENWKKEKEALKATLGEEEWATLEGIEETALKMRANEEALATEKEALAAEKEALAAEKEALAARLQEEGKPEEGKVGEVGYEMVKVPGGEFVMGSPEG